MHANGIEQTSRQTTRLIHQMKDLMLGYKRKMRDELPKIYSQDLLNNLFRHPYTKIDFVMTDLQVGRITATKYLDELVRIGLLSKHKKWKDNYYMNDVLIHLLINGGLNLSSLMIKNLQNLDMTNSSYIENGCFVYMRHLSCIKKTTYAKTATDF